MTRNVIAQAVAAAFSKPLNRLMSNGLLDLKALSTQPRGWNEAAIRQLCAVAYLGGDTALCRTLGRYKMFVDTTDVGLSSHLMLDGYWEMWITEALAAAIRPGMVVADIGANIGYFTLLMADLVGPAGKVHAFEPNPRMTSRLAKSLSLNGFSERVELHEIALADVDGGEVVLFVPPEEPKNAKIFPDRPDLEDHHLRVPVARLDSRPDWSEIELAKVDIEGAEELLWKGMGGLIAGSRLKTLILEYSIDRCEDPVGFLDAICATDFSLAYVDPARGITPTTREWVLSRPRRDDTMLYLTR